jgi:hypothetical protein
MRRHRVDLKSIFDGNVDAQRDFNTLKNRPLNVIPAKAGT